MRKRHPNPRLAKIHRNYTVEEIANLFGVHKNSVRNWVKGGLPISDDRRPMLILGRDLVAFLHARRVKNKRPCQPGEIYCMRCRTAQRPAGDMAESMMYRRVNRAKLVQVGANLDITMPQAPPHIDESPQPCVNSDLNQEATDHDHTQRQQ